MRSLTDGPRACRPEERSELLALINLVFRVSRGRAPSIERDYPHIYRTANLENVRVISVDGGLRASVGTVPMRIAIHGTALDTVGVNCTTTHPDWRNHGLGGLLMRDVEARARAAGGDLVHLDAGGRGRPETDGRPGGRGHQDRMARPSRFHAHCLAHGRSHR